MLGRIATGVAIFGVAGSLALGQTVSIRSLDSAGNPDGRTYGQFSPGETFEAALLFSELGDLTDWSVKVLLGPEVEVVGEVTFGQAFLSGAPFTDVQMLDDGVSIAHSIFLDPNPITVGAEELAATFDLRISDAGSDTNTFLGVSTDPDDTFFTSTGGDVTATVGDLAVGGQLVPEPATLALVLVGIGGGAIAHRRRRRA